MKRSEVRKIKDTIRTLEKLKCVCQIFVFLCMILVAGLVGRSDMDIALGIYEHSNLWYFGHSLLYIGVAIFLLYISYMIGDHIKDLRNSLYK